MIVVDTCIIVYLFNESDLTPLAINVLEKDPLWLIPSLWQQEYANVLAKNAKLLKIKVEKVIENLTYVLEELSDQERNVDIQRDLELAIKKDITVYDAHFVSLAEEHNTFLITEDREIIKKCPNIALSMKDYLNTR